MRVVKALLILLAAFVLAKEVAAQGQQETTADPSRAKAARVARPSIVFGHEGGNLRPYTIGIYADGQVRALTGNPPLKTNQVAPEKVRELVQQAGDKNFWKTDAGETQMPKLADFGFVFVRVRLAERPHGVIVHRGAEVGPLGEFYGLLSDLVIVQP